VSLPIQSFNHLAFFITYYNNNSSISNEFIYLSKLYK
jgi:hypothetical protein